MSESQEILECVLDNVPEAVRIMDLGIVTKEKNGHSSELGLRVALANPNGRLRGSAIVQEPHDLRGSAYLYIKEAEGSSVYYYNPVLQKTRKVTGDSQSGELFDTAISFHDFEILDKTLRSSSITLRPAKADQPDAPRRFIVLPPPNTDLPFTRVHLDVDTERCVIIHAEALDHSRQVVRRLSAPVADLQQYDNRYWFPTRLLVENLESGRRSEIRVRGLEVLDELPVARFDPQRFYQ